MHLGGDVFISETATLDVTGGPPVRATLFPPHAFADSRVVVTVTHCAEVQDRRALTRLRTSPGPLLPAIELAVLIQSHARFAEKQGMCSWSIHLLCFFSAAVTPATGA